MSPRKRSRLLLVVAAFVLLVGAIAVAAFLSLTRDTSDPALRLSDSQAGPGAGAGAAVDPAALDGTWRVVPGRGRNATVAGYRVTEAFVAGARKSTVNGRTKDVTGSLTVADGAATNGSFTVEMTTLASDDPKRDKAIEDQGLQTKRFSKGTFAITEPITLPRLMKGRTARATATGELTLHGTARPVAIDLEVLSSGRTFTVQGSAPVTLADYGIEAPAVPGVVAVQDTGSFEFIVNLERA